MAVKLTSKDEEPKRGNNVRKYNKMCGNGGS